MAPTAAVTQAAPTVEAAKAANTAEPEGITDMQDKAQDEFVATYARKFDLTITNTTTYDVKARTTLDKIQAYYDSKGGAAGWSTPGVL